MSLRNSPVHAGLAVSDLQAARRFYEQQLGLVPADEEDEGVRYLCGEGTGLFVYLSPAHAGKATATLAGWSVDDLDATMADLASRGVTFEHYDEPSLATDEHGVLDAGRFRAAWMKDPEGNVLALTEQRGSE